LIKKSDITEKFFVKGNFHSKYYTEIGSEDQFTNASLSSIILYDRKSLEGAEVIEILPSVAELGGMVYSKDLVFDLEVSPKQNGKSKHLEFPERLIAADLVVVNPVISDVFSDGGFTYATIKGVAYAKIIELKEIKVKTENNEIVLEKKNKKFVLIDKPKKPILKNKTLGSAFVNSKYGSRINSFFESNDTLNKAETKANLFDTDEEVIDFNQPSKDGNNSNGCNPLNSGGGCGGQGCGTMPGCLGSGCSSLPGCNSGCGSGCIGGSCFLRGLLMALGLIGMLLTLLFLLCMLTGGGNWWNNDDESKWTEDKVVVDEDADLREEKEKKNIKKKKKMDFDKSELEITVTDWHTPDRDVISIWLNDELIAKDVEIDESVQVFYSNKFLKNKLNTLDVECVSQGLYGVASPLITIGEGENVSEFKVNSKIDEVERYLISITE
jgi:hypothetical protein